MKETGAAPNLDTYIIPSEVVRCALPTTHLPLRWARCLLRCSCMVGSVCECDFPQQYKRRNWYFELILFSKKKKLMVQSSEFRMARLC